METLFNVILKYILINRPYTFRHIGTPNTNNEASVTGASKCSVLTIFRYEILQQSFSVINVIKELSLIVRADPPPVV